MMRYQVRVSLPNLPDLRIGLEGEGPWLFGRSPDSTIPLKGLGVSGTHFRIFLENNELAFEDLRSRYGTILNGKRSGGGPLAPGSLLQAGEATLRIEEAVTEALSVDPAAQELVILSRCVTAKGSAAEGAFDLASLSGLIEKCLDETAGRDVNSALCRAFAESLGCTSAKCFLAAGEDDPGPAALCTAVGPFPEERLPPFLCEALARFPLAAMAEKRDPGQKPLGLLVLPVSWGKSRLVFLGIAPGRQDLLVAYPDRIYLFSAIVGILREWIAETGSRQREIERLKTRLRAFSEADVAPILGESPALLRTLDQLERAAPSTISVLLLGETGTGKELFARRLHGLSERGGPFVAVNCAAIPETLLESELMGYQKGAFTGAASAKKGLIEEADGGTLFLDEITDASLSTQASLLRVLHEGEVRRVGATRAVAVHVRIVSATNKEIEEEIAGGRFRQDLYYRLAAMPIRIPPLRERGGDVALLANAFLRRFCREENKALHGFEEGGLRAMKEHSWPGNVRELERLIQRLVILASDRVIGEDEVRDALKEVAAKKPTGIGSLLNQPWQDAREAFEEMYFRARFSRKGQPLSELAKEMGIARQNVYEKMRKYGLKG